MKAFLRWATMSCCSMTRMLWNDYVPVYGSDDTLGFSIIADAGHVGQVSTVYGPSAFGSNGSPKLFDVLIYDETGNQFATAFNSLSAQGYAGVPWIIGEAYYNDAAEATAPRQQANSTGQKVLYLTEWPETADQVRDQCECGAAGGLLPLSSREFLKLTR
jgi:hypothetical protein